MINIDQPTPNSFDLPALKEAESALENYAQAIDKYRNIGTYLILMEAKKVDAHPEVSAAVIGLFRRLLELMDASAILLREGSVIPVLPLVRIMLELGFQFEYLLKDPARREEKAFCMFIAELNEALVNDTKLLTIPFIERAQSPAVIRAQIAAIQSNINDPRFNSIRVKYDQVTAIKNSAGIATGERRGAKWFTIADATLTTVDKLINIDLKREKFQSLIYSELSHVVHSSSLMTATLYIVDGVPSIKPFRVTKDANDVTDTILKVATFMYDLMWKRQTFDERNQFFAARIEFAKKYPAYWHAVYIGYM